LGEQMQKILVPLVIGFLIVSIVGLIFFFKKISKKKIDRMM